MGTLLLWWHRINNLMVYFSSFQSASDCIPIVSSWLYFWLVPGWVLTFCGQCIPQWWSCFAQDGSTFSPGCSTASNRYIIFSSTFYLLVKNLNWCSTGAHFFPPIDIEPRIPGRRFHSQPIFWLKSRKHFGQKSYSAWQPPFASQDWYALSPIP